MMREKYFTPDNMDILLYHTETTMAMAFTVPNRLLEQLQQIL
jgi:hypothetical protein